MLPFTSDLYFYTVALLAIPAIVLGFLGKRLKYYGVFVTIVFALTVFNDPKKLTFLILFYLYSIIVALVYSKLGSIKQNKFVFPLFMLIMLIPLIISKFKFGGFSVLGISYMSFRSIQLIQELKTGKIKTINMLDATYFILFFPAVSSGPIDRYLRFKKDLDKTFTKDEYLSLLREGIWKIMTGLLYSFAISPFINQVLMPASNKGVLSTIQYMYAYTFYLFFNFAGYSNLAIGTSYIFGITLPENFNMPFVSVDLKDFWARWHMSLSTFFRDYIYNRFVTASLKGKWFKNIYVGSYIGYVITMFVMGIWHGFQINYIIYGLYHGVLLCLNEWLDVNIKPFKKFKNSNWGSVICFIITFHLIAFGFLIFSGRIIS